MTTGLCVCRLWKSGFYDDLRALYFDFSASPLYLWKKQEKKEDSLRIALVHAPDMVEDRQRLGEG